MPITVIALSSLILILDQISKFYISSALSLGQSIPVVRDIFHISLVYNTGAAFGLFKNQKIFFIILTAAVVMYIIRDLFFHGSRYSLGRRVALGLILGGAAGNFVDRLRLGYIIDFLDFRVWPVFNLADSAITVGIIILGCSLLKRAPGHQSARAPEHQSTRAKG